MADAGLFSVDSTLGSRISQLAFVAVRILGPASPLQARGGVVKVEMGSWAKVWVGAPSGLPSDSVVG